MNGDIGVFLSSFGGAGMFIWYLLQREKTVTKEQTQAIASLGKKVDNLVEASDDDKVLLMDLLDTMDPIYEQKRSTQILKSRIKKRQLVREKNQIIETVIQ